MCQALPVNSNFLSSSLVSAPPTPNTMTATRAIQPTFDSTGKRLHKQHFLVVKLRHFYLQHCISAQKAFKICRSFSASEEKAKSRRGFGLNNELILMIAQLFLLAGSFPFVYLFDDPRLCSSRLVLCR